MDDFRKLVEIIIIECLCRSESTQFFLNFEYLYRFIGVLMELVCGTNTNMLYLRKIVTSQADWQAGLGIVSQYCIATCCHFVHGEVSQCYLVCNNLRRYNNLICSSLIRPIFYTSC